MYDSDEYEEYYPRFSEESDENEPETSSCKGPRQKQRKTSTPKKAVTLRRTPSCCRTSVHQRTPSPGPSHRRTLSPGPSHQRTLSPGPSHQRTLSPGPSHQRTPSPSL
ncbi:hypothetical protein Pcinc_034234 [Petrolisthes cinctipes]|uniref:Uncharacterized protein n=1 Tax=Petrolisthes cinctipes TaxID=88211 RepID=A0AAE1EQM0_PETCI|nr:hypothetical protein Pcinc_034234 [Petrolisthes cinctipes]